MKAIEKILQKEGVSPDDFEAEKDVDDLVTQKIITKVQAVKFKKHIRDRKANAQALPFPKLKENVVLKPADLNNWRPEVASCVALQAGEEDKALDFNSLKASDQLSIFMNCSFTRGLNFNQELSPSSLHPLLPPNCKMQQFMVPSNESEQYRYEAMCGSKFKKLVSMTDTGASASLATPWVAGSLSFSKSHEKQNIEEGTSYTNSTKYMLPICRFDLLPHHVIKVEENDKGPIIVNPDLIRKVEELIKQPSLTFDEVRKEIFVPYGDVIATSAEIGIACHKTEAKTSDTRASLDEKKEQLQASLGGGFGPVKAEVGAHHGTLDANEDRRGDSRASSTWTVIAGAAAKSDNPRDIIKFRHDPLNWRVINYKSFSPLIDILPYKLKMKLEAKLKKQLDTLKNHELGMVVEALQPQNGGFHLKDNNGRFLCYSSLTEFDSDNDVFVQFETEITRTSMKPIEFFHCSRHKKSIYCSIAGFDPQCRKRSGKSFTMPQGEKLYLYIGDRSGRHLLTNNPSFTSKYIWSQVDDISDTRWFQNEKRGNQSVLKWVYN